MKSWSRIWKKCYGINIIFCCLRVRAQCERMPSNLVTIPTYLAALFLFWIVYVCIFSLLLFNLCELCMYLFDSSMHVVVIAGFGQLCRNISATTATRFWRTTRHPWERRTTAEENTRRMCASSTSSGWKNRRRSWSMPRPKRSRKARSRTTPLRISSGHRDPAVLGFRLRRICRGTQVSLRCDRWWALRVLACRRSECPWWEGCRWCGLVCRRWWCRAHPWACLFPRVNSCVVFMIAFWLLLTVIPAHPVENFLKFISANWRFLANSFPFTLTIYVTTSS